MTIVFIAVLAAGVHFPIFSAYTAITMALWCGIIIVGACASVLFARDES